MEMWCGGRQNAVVPLAGSLVLQLIVWMEEGSASLQRSCTDLRLDFYEDHYKWLLLAGSGIPGGQSSVKITSDVEVWVKTNYTPQMILKLHLKLLTKSAISFLVLYMSASTQSLNCKVKPKVIHWSFLHLLFIHFFFFLIELSCSPSIYIVKSILLISNAPLAAERPLSFLVSGSGGVWVMKNEETSRRL